MKLYGSHRAFVHIILSFFWTCVENAMKDRTKKRHTFISRSYFIRITCLCIQIYFVFTCMSLACAVVAYSFSISFNALDKKGTL